MTNSRRLLKSLMSLTLASLFVVGACGDDDGTGPEPGEVDNEETVTLNGAEVSLGGGTQQGGVTVSVPQGAVTAPVTITMTESASSPAVSDQAQTGSVFELGPAGTQFLVPVRVTIPYPSGFAGDAGALLMFTTDAAGSPELLSEIAVFGGQSVSGKTTHFSPFWASASGYDPISITVSPTSLTLASGASATLTPEARNVAGRLIPVSKYAVSYSSSDAGIASVNTAGTITAGKVGTATITAAVGSHSTTMAVSVINGALSSFSVTPATAEIKVGETQTFVATGTDAAGNDLGQFEGVTWTSSDPAVARVTGSGGTIGVAPGTATISAALQDATGMATLTVKPDDDVVVPAGVDSILSVAPETAALRSGQTAALTATTVRSDGTASTAADVTWTSRDAAVASVTGVGMVTGLKVGTTYVVGSTGFGSDSTMITVTAGPPAKVMLSADSLEVPTGAEEPLTATVMDANGNMTGDVLAWTSANVKVAVVNQLGTVRGVSVGVTSVTAATSNGISASAMIYVASGLPVDLAFNPDPASVRAGEMVAVDIIPQDARGRTTILPDTMPLMLVVRDTSIAKVDMKGLVGTVSGFKLGTTWLVATAGVLIDSVQITTVPGVAATTQFLSPSKDTTVTAGDVVQVTMRGTDVLGNVFTQTGFVLASGDAAILEVQDGLKFMGKKVGTTTLSAAVDAITKSINVTVQVGPAASVTVTEPSVDTTMTSGGNVTMKAVVADQFGNPRNDAVAFTTDDATVIALAGAVATAAKVGTATVTATSGTLTDTRGFTVVHGAAATMQWYNAADQAISAISVGQLDTLMTNAKGTDAAGNEFSDGITYSTADAGIAAVMASGALIGVGLGNVEAYATRDGVVDTLAVTVKQGTLKSVDITPTTATANAINQVLKYIAVGKDRGGSSITGVTFAWTIDKPAVATLVGAADTAKVTAVGNGTATLTVTATKEGASATKTATVVVDVKANTVTIVPDTATLEAPGATVDLSGRVTAKDSGGNTIIGPTVSWSSTNTSVATVSAAGVVTAVAGGQAGIIALVDAAADTATVTVDIKADSIFISPVADTTVVGGNVQFTVKAYSGGQEIQANVTWTSTTPAVATVDITGKATGVAAGVTKIVATSGNAADTASLGVAGANSIVSTAFPNGSALATLTAGQEFTVAVTFDMNRVSGNGDVGSVQFDFDYDAAKIEVVSTDKGGMAGTVEINTDVAGKVKYALINLAPQGSSDLTLVTVTFKVKAGAATGRSAFSLTYTALPTTSGFVNYEAPVAVAGEVQIN